MNGLNQTQQSASTPGSVQPTGTSDSFYKFFNYGARIGFFDIAKHSPDNDDAPELLSYLDVGIGRFSNLATSFNCTRYHGCGNTPVPPSAPVPFSFGGLVGHTSSQGAKHWLQRQPRTARDRRTPQRSITAGRSALPVRLQAGSLEVYKESTWARVRWSNEVKTSNPEPPHATWMNRACSVSLVFEESF